MSVSIRLNRKGTKDRPYYKIVAVDSRKRRDGRYIEQVGTYDPLVEGAARRDGAPGGGGVTGGGVAAGGSSTTRSA